jgi:uncharacterized Fe-S cluster protein YjdI
MHPFRGVPENASRGVYKPKESPWISVDNARSEELRSQVNSCPSGALRYTEDK